MTFYYIAAGVVLAGLVGFIAETLTRSGPWDGPRWVLLAYELLALVVGVLIISARILEVRRW